MIIDEKVLARDFTPEGQARRMELEFISTTIELMKEKVDPTVVQHRVSYILMGLTGILYGAYGAEGNAPIPLPRNQQAATEVREMWKSLIIPVKRYCQISERKCDDRKLRCMVLRIHDRLFQAMRNSVFC